MKTWFSAILDGSPIATAKGAGHDSLASLFDDLKGGRVLIPKTLPPRPFEVVIEENDLSGVVARGKAVVFADHVERVGW